MYDFFIYPIMNNLSKKQICFTKIANISSTGYYNIKCTVLNIYDWIPTKAKDYVMTLKVIDDSIDLPIFIKIFSPLKIFINYFKINKSYLVYGVKKYKDSFFILSKENKIEEHLKTNDALEEYNDEENFCKNKNYNDQVNNKSQVMQINKENIFLNKKEFFLLKEIKDLSSIEYIKFIGKLINIQEESNNLIILSFIDYTVNPLIVNVNGGRYDNNMVLFVKVWDKLAILAKNLEIDNIYTLENVKIHVKFNVIIGTLSDTPLSKIYKSDSSFISEREKEYLAKCIDFSCDHYKNMKITNINDIKESGYYKIKVNMIKYFPENGKILYLCKKCKIINEVYSFDCNCKNDKITIFTLKYQVKDESGENIVVCVNKIAKKMLKINVNEMYLYIKSKKMNKIFVHEVKKIPEKF